MGDGSADGRRWRIDAVAAVGFAWSSILAACQVIRCIKDPSAHDRSDFQLQESRTSSATRSSKAAPAMRADESVAAGATTLWQDPPNELRERGPVHFQLSDEQTIIKDTLARFLADRYDIVRRRGYLAEPRGFSEANWQQLAELGLTTLPFPERLGGMGGSGAETMIVMEEIGYHCAVEPFAPSIIAAAEALSRADDDDVARKHVADLASGAVVLTYALFEERAPHDPLRIGTRAIVEDGSYLLSGSKRLAPYPAADLFLVSALAPRPEGGEDVALFLVPKDAPGVAVVEYRTVDGLPACDLQFAAAPTTELLVGLENGRAATSHLCSAMAFAHSAEAVGILRRMLETTTNYMKSRVQFGRPLAAKQVVRHRIAEMYMQYELARSMVIGAAVREPGSPEWRCSVAAAKVMVNTAADFVAKQAVQLHGGMGVSDEYEISHYYKRLMVLKALFGDTREHASDLGGMVA